MWHASGQAKTLNVKHSRALAKLAIQGVGDRARPDWEEEGSRSIWHVQRLLTRGERDLFGIEEPRDIRGTQEEREIIAAVLAEAPQLIAHFGGAA